MVDLVGQLQEAGWDVWVVTASARAIVTPFAARAGVPADRVLGMELAATDDHLEREVTGTVTYRQGKVDALRHATGRTADFAAGDSITDLELLRSARYRLYIHRHEVDMHRIATDEGWWLQEGWS